MPIWSAPKIFCQAVRSASNPHAQRPSCVVVSNLNAGGSCSRLENFAHSSLLLLGVSSFSGTLSSCLLASSFPPHQKLLREFALFTCVLCVHKQSSPTHHSSLTKDARKQAGTPQELSLASPPTTPSHVLLHDSPPSGPHETSTTMAKGRVWRCRPSSHHLRHRPRTLGFLCLPSLDIHPARSAHAWTATTPQNSSPCLKDGFGPSHTSAKRHPLTHPPTHSYTCTHSPRWRKKPRTDGQQQPWGTPLGRSSPRAQAPATRK